MSDLVRLSTNKLLVYSLVRDHFWPAKPNRYQQMALNHRQIISLTPHSKPYNIANGGGLSVRVTPTGGKQWRLAYRFGGKQKEMALGSFPAIGLAEARDLRTQAKTHLENGIDPIDHAKRLERQKKVDAASTFGHVADELIAKCIKEGLADATLTKKRWFLSLVEKDLSQQSISQIKASDVLEPLRRIEAQGNYETARRLRAFISQVFRYAIATSRAENDPTYGLRGALITPKVEHRAAIIDQDGFSALVRAIWAFEGSNPSTRAGLKLMALLYPRPGELRLARWVEFDLVKGTWTIPASRAKMRRAHIKPLSKTALEVLEQQRQYVGGEGFVFPSELSRGKPISENTLNGALRRKGFSKEEMTAHGFRASASSLLNESGQFNADAIEAELAHVGADQVRKAYHRATYWDERVRMAEWWGNFVTG
jgi:integrase